jgi:peptidyl-prolyl cis-trans isomerase A (cyclophilin A)
VKGFTLWLGLLILVCLVPNALWGQASSTTTKPAPAAQQKSSSSKAGASLLHPETLKAKAPDVYEVKFTTTKGDFVIQVTRAWAPLGADRFYDLVKYHFYDGVIFFRVVPGFVVQFGLTGSPAVNKAWQEARIKGDPVTQSNRPGFITYAMAAGDTNSRTTQVFINLGNNSSNLDGQGFAPFGNVTSGMDIVSQLYGGYADSPTGHQEEITTQGNAYLEKNYPKLDSIKTARIVSPASGASAPAAGGEKPKP